MCAICGIKSLNSGSENTTRLQFFKMLNSLNHRGPDFQGNYINENLHLGSARLKILDLEDRSNMPMQFENYIIVFNGEIYNHKELRTKLEDSGEVFLTTSDTEVILRLYKVYRFESFNMLEGMFALCIYDIKKKEVILARDIFGIKPLYYCFYNKIFIFSSEIKSIVNNINIKFDKNNFAIYSYLHKGSIIEPNTQFSNIFSLLPGNIMIIKNNLEYEIKEFASVCSMIKNSENSDRKYSKDEFFYELNKQIYAHAQSDVPMSLMLSSGIDSIYINQLLKNSITPFTMSYDFCKNTSNDEIGEIKKHFPIKKHLVNYFKESEVKIVKNNFSHLSDTLSIDGVQFLLISEYIKKNNFKVTMAGFGADEIFNAYPSYKYLNFFNIIKKVIPDFPPHNLNISNYKLKKLINLLLYSSSLEEMYLNFRSIFFTDEILNIMSNKNKIEEYRMNLLGHYGKYTKDITLFNNKIKSLEINVYLRDQVLKDLDWASMKYSLEVRVPYLSKSLLKMSATPNLANSLNKNDLFVYSKLNKSNYFYQYKKKGFSTPDSILKNQRKFVLENYNLFVK